MYGAQAMQSAKFPYNPFENDVEMYGAQAMRLPVRLCKQFENDVEMYGAQAKESCCISELCLRMM